MKTFPLIFVALFLFSCTLKKIKNDLTDDNIKGKVKTIIENKDFAEILTQYDGPQTFFYCDPPYNCGGADYTNRGITFTADDHERLRLSLAKIKGKFILSLNDSPENAESYKQYNIKKISCNNGVNRKHIINNKYAELIIYNFDLAVRGAKNGIV